MFEQETTQKPNIFLIFINGEINGEDEVVWLSLSEDNCLMGKYP